MISAAVSASNGSCSRNSSYAITPSEYTSVCARDRRAARLLGREVLRRADELAFDRVLDVVSDDLRDAPVEQLDARRHRIFGVVDQEHVVELEVAVDDAGGVRGDQRVADLEQDRDHAVGQDLALVGAQSPSGTPSSRSITMYGPAVGQRAGLEDVDDVRVADLVDDPRLEQHALAVEAGVTSRRCTTLSAARLPISSCTTAYTAPMPPRPSSRSTIHGPAFAPGGSASGLQSAPSAAAAPAPAVLTMVFMTAIASCSRCAAPKCQCARRGLPAWPAWRVRRAVAHTHGGSRVSISPMRSSRATSSRRRSRSLREMPQIRAPASSDRASVAWQFGGDLAVFLGGGRAALLQLAHPMVAFAIAQHSHTRADVVGRFQRTFRNVFAMVFGELDEAFRAARRVHAIHARIHGEIPTRSAAGAPARRYHANDADALRWVHATLVDTTLVVRELLDGPLPRRDQGSLRVEMNRFARAVRDPACAAAATLGRARALHARDARVRSLAVAPCRARDGGFLIGRGGDRAAAARPDRRGGDGGAVAARPRGAVRAARRVAARGARRRSRRSRRCIAVCPRACVAIPARSAAQRRLAGLPPSRLGAWTERQLFGARRATRSSRVSREHARAGREQVLFCRKSWEAREPTREQRVRIRARTRRTVALRAILRRWLTRIARVRRRTARRVRG